MPGLYTKLTSLPVNYAAWVLDYWYVFRWQLASLLGRADAAKYLPPVRNTGDHPGIILVPGILENWLIMKPVADVLARHGYAVHVIEKLGYNTGSVDEAAAMVEDYISSNSIGPCVVVAHSKGGLIGKYLLARHNDSGTVKGLVTINTPFSGSPYAIFIPFKPIRIFLPNSSLLLTLAAERAVNRQIVSIYGQFDPHIPRGSHLEGARNIKLGVRGHFRVLNSRRVHAAVLESVELLSR